MNTRPTPTYPSTPMPACVCIGGACTCAHTRSVGRSRHVTRREGTRTPTLRSVDHVSSGYGHGAFDRRGSFTDPPVPVGGRTGDRCTDAHTRFYEGVNATFRVVAMRGHVVTIGAGDDARSNVARAGSRFEARRYGIRLLGAPGVLLRVPLSPLRAPGACESHKSFVPAMVSP